MSVKLAHPSIRLTGSIQREYAKEMIDQAPTGYLVKIAPETRVDAQNRKMWAMIKDMQNQVEAMRVHDADDIKLQFLHALGREMRFLPMLDGRGVFPVGQKSSELSKKEFADLIELMYAYGSSKGVLWTEEYWND